MTDGGDKPLEKFDIEPSKDGKSVTIVPKKDAFGGKPVEFGSVTLKVKNGQTFVVEKLDKDQKPEGVLKPEEEIVTPEKDGEKTVKFTLPEYTPSSGIRITAQETPESDKPTTMTPTTVVACLPETGNIVTCDKNFRQIFVKYLKIWN